MHTFLHEGQEIEPYFDSLLAKLISLGKDREEAISKLKRALEEFQIEGVPTTIPFFKVLLEKEDFKNGNYFTNYIEKSGILRELFPQKIVEIPRMEIEEKEIAEIIFQIYKSLKEKEISPEKKEVSNWVMSERLKMLEQK